MSDIQSRPFRPNPDKCCERCVWGTGEHAEWCENRTPDSRDRADEIPPRSAIEDATGSP